MLEGPLLNEKEICFSLPEKPGRMGQFCDHGSETGIMTKLQLGSLAGESWRNTGNKHLSNTSHRSD